MKMGDFTPIENLVYDNELDATRLVTRELYCEQKEMFGKGTWGSDCYNSFDN